MVKDDFHEWKKGNHENRGFLWRKRGEKWRLVVQVRKGKKGDFAAVSSHEINRIFEYKKGTAMKIWVEA